MERQMRKRVRIQKQNSGFSLVELIIAIAILVIVTGAVCSFIVITSRNYANGNNDINVQQEAQLALNQMSDVIIDAMRSINYVGYDESNQPVKAMKDSEFAFTPEKKALLVYNVEVHGIGGAASELHNYMFYWQKSDENLYFSVADASGKFLMPGESTTDCVLLAENVTDFQVDLSQVEEKRVVKLKLSFKTGNRKFEMANNITVRNKVLINNEDIAPLDKRVRVSVSVKEPTVVLEPGETYHFSTPKVTGTNLLNKAVTWSVEGAVGEGTSMTDTANGILKIGEKETHQSFQVKVTTNAKNDDSNSPAEAAITVYVKRVTKVTLYKKSDDVEDTDGNKPGALEVMQGSTVVIGGSADGVKLGNRCASCEEDAAKDKYLTDWKVVDGAGLLEGGIKDSDYETATIQVKADAAVGSTITIQATSDLSKRKVYDNVSGTITLKVVKKKESTKPLPSGDLEYGKITMVTGSTISQFTTAINSHVLAIHIVDMSGEEPVRYILCYNSGWEIPLDPGFFGLNLNKRYGFYLQGIECVTQEEMNRYSQFAGTLHRASDDEIRQDYRAHVQSQVPFAYTGTKFRSADVYQTMLEPVQATYEYNSKEYSGENITFKTVNLLASDAKADNILDGLSFKRMTNINNNSVLNCMKYSVYKKNGDNWDPIYVFDGKQYTGNSNNYNGNLIIDNQGSYSEPHIKVGTGDLKNVVGTYRIVPGIYYEVKSSQKPEHIIDPLDFKFANNGQKTYYELTESTFYVTVTAEGTMDINSDRFTGSVCFPLPAEMKNNSIFTGLNQSEWHDANIQDKDNGVEYKTIDSNNKISKIKFNRIRYRYIQSENAYEVEPMWETTKTGGLKITYSYGVYKCAANGSKWQCVQGAKETNNITFKFDSGNETWAAHLPLPTDDDFMFTKESTERQKKQLKVTGYNVPKCDQSKDISNNWTYCDYDSATGSYTLTFATDEQTQGITKTIRVSGVYTWKPGETQWQKVQGEGTLTENLGNIKFILDGKTYDALVELPTSDQFMFVKNQTDKQTKTGVWITGYNEQNHSETKNIECKVIYCTYDSNTGSYTFLFANKTDTTGIIQKVEYLGAYQWKPGDKEWTKIKGAYTESQSIANTTITWNGENYVAYIPLPSSDDFWYRWGINNPDWNHGNLQLYKSTDTDGKDPVSPGYTYIRVSKDQTAGTFILNMIKKVDYPYSETTLFSLQCSLAGTTWTQVN